MTESMRSRGMRDMLPQEMERFRTIENAFRDVCLGWGYREVRTPTIEHLYLFTAAGTLSPQMLDGVYSFLDWDGWSGERVVLRPDSTIPTSRLFAENMAGEVPARLFYVQNVFRFQPGDDTREDWQCGAELIGAEPPQGDAELVAMALETLQRLGVEASLKLSDPGILRAILVKARVSHTEQSTVYDRVLAGDLKALAELQPKLPGAPNLADTLSMQGSGVAYLNNLRALLSESIPELTAPLDELTSTCETLAGVGVEAEVAPLLVRDFEYYTGPAFQIFAGDTRVGGGGRYDALVSQIGGAHTPASGFALEFEPLVTMVEPRPTAEAAISIRCEAGGNPADAFALAVALRRKDLAVEVGGANRGKHITVSGDGFSVSVNGGNPRSAATIDEAIAAVSGS